MKIRTHCLSRTPRRIEPAGPIAFDAEQVQSPLRIAIKVLCEASHRNSQLRNPDMFPSGDGRAGLHGAHEIGTAGRGNIQVNPIAVWADLKFLVVSPSIRVGLKKYFYDIAQPKFLMALVGLRVDINVPVMSFKTQIEGLRRPQHPHLCLSLRIGFLSLPVCAEDDWPGSAPVVIAGKHWRVQWPTKMRCNDLACALSTICRRIHGLMLVRSNLLCCTKCVPGRGRRQPDHGKCQQKRATNL